MVNKTINLIVGNYTSIHEGFKNLKEVQRQNENVCFFNIFANVQISQLSRMIKYGALLSLYPWVAMGMGAAVRRPTTFYQLTSVDAYLAGSWPNCSQ